MASMVAWPAFAADPCQYFLTAPVDDGECAFGGSNASTGGSFPSFVDAFNLNPATIPTLPTPFGLEGIVSNNPTGGSDYVTNFGLIKGFQNIGLAASSNSDNTFFSNSILQSLAGSAATRATYAAVIDSATKPALNVGSAFRVNIDGLNIITVPSFGAEARYNRLTDQWDSAFGVSFNGHLVHFGISTIRESQSVKYPTGNTTVYSGGIKIPHVHLEYTLLKYVGTLYSQETHIWSASLRMQKLLLSGAIRAFDTLGGPPTTQTQFTAQYKILDQMVLGYYYNYVIDAQSVGVQIFL